MHINALSAYALIAVSLVSALPTNHVESLERRDALVQLDEVFDAAKPVLMTERGQENFWERDDESLYSDLEKRRGGGGKGGGGSKGGGSSSGSSGSSSGSSGSSSGGKGISSSSSAGRSFGGGRYYAGGSSTAYTAGGRSPSGISPVVLGGGLGLGLGAAAIYPYGYYGYPYAHSYSYHNSSTNSDQNLPVECVCQMYNACGCDDSGNSTNVAEMVKNGSVAKVEVVNGTRKVIVNGTLPNGTDDSSSSGGSGVSFLRSGLGGYWAMAAVVAGMVWGL